MGECERITAEFAMVMTTIRNWQTAGYQFESFLPSRETVELAPDEA
jgi:hypothetical protein